MNIWSYWDGPRSTIHDLCLESIRRHHPELDVYCRRRAQAMLDDCGSKIRLDGMPANHASDVVRWHLLRKHGGLWLDADTVVLRRMGWWTDQLETFECLCSQRWIFKSEFNTAILAVRAGSWVAEEMCRRIEIAVADGTATRRWSSIGPIMLASVMREASLKRVPVLNVSGELVYPLPFSAARRPEFHLRRTDDGHMKHFQPNAWCYGLVHEIVDGYRAWDRDKLLASNRFISFLLRKALA